MPKKNRKTKKSENPEIDTKRKQLLSKNIPSPYRDESTSAEGNSSSISAAVKSEESSTDSERHGKAVSHESSQFPQFSEGKLSYAGISRLVNDGSSASLLQEVREIDNVGNLKTINDTSTDDVPVIHGDENVAWQEESSEAFLLDSEPAGLATKNENVCGQISKAKSSHSENDVSQEKLTEGNLSLDFTLSSDATIEQDVFCGSKQFVAGASSDENIISQEKSSNEAALSSDSAAAGVSEIKEKVTMKDEIDSMFQVDLNPCSFTAMHKVEGDSAELRPKCPSIISSLGVVKTDSQLELSLVKGKSKMGAPFKHTTDASSSENTRKRSKTSSTVTPKKTSQQTNKKKNQKLRAKSEQTTKTNSEFLSEKKSEKAVSSPGTYFSTQEENVERQNYGQRVSNRDTSEARESNTCNPEKEEFVAESKCSQRVSPLKRKSENTSSFLSENVLEPIPYKRVQKGSETLASSTNESKSSQRVKTSAKSRRSRKKSKKGSKCDTTKPESSSTAAPTTLNEPSRDVISQTLSMTEYVGDAAYIAIGETPPLKHEASVSSTHESENSSEVKSKPKFKQKIYRAKSRSKSRSKSKEEKSKEEPDRYVITQTESMKEYLEIVEDSSTDGGPMQPMRVLSSEVPSIGAECLHAASSIPHRNLNASNIPGSHSAIYSTEREAEHSSTVSSWESTESDIHTKQEHSVAYRGARPKTRGKNSRETSPQKGCRKGHVGDILTVGYPESSTEANSSPAGSSKRDVKEIDNFCKQSSSTICMGERPKTRGKNIQISTQRGDDIGRPHLARATAESQSNSNELFPSFEEFKETLGVDKVEVVDINYDVFDRALGIDRSSDHSVREHRQEFKMISPKRFSEAVTYDRKNLKSVGYGSSSSDPQSSKMVEQDSLPTIEEFRKTLRADAIPPISEEVAFEIINKALEEMESQQRNLRSKKVVRFLIPKEEALSMSARTSPEEQIDEAASSRPCINRDPIPGILAFSGYHERGSPMGLAVPDCFDLKSIADALDEVLRSEFMDTAGEAHNDPRQPEVFEDSEESIEDINRSIAKSGMKLKRSQFISSDDEFTSARTSEPVEVSPQFLTRDRPNITFRIQRNSSETSESSDANSEECNGSSSESDETPSESVVEFSESDEKSAVSGQKIEFPQITLEQSSSERHLSEPSDDSDNASPNKRRRKNDVEKTI